MTAAYGQEGDAMNWHIYHVESGTFLGEYEAVDDREAMALFLDDLGEPVEGNIRAEKPSWREHDTDWE